MRADTTKAAKHCVYQGSESLVSNDGTMAQHASSSVRCVCAAAEGGNEEGGDEEGGDAEGGDAYIEKGRDAAVQIRLHGPARVT